MITEKPGKNYVEFKHRHEEEQCLQIGAIHGKINDVARIMSPQGATGIDQVPKKYIEIEQAVDVLN